MKINKKDFKTCAKKLVEDPSLQRIETEDFIFIRPDGTITVKFKKIDRLTGYFTLDEFKNWRMLSATLKTLEKELERKGV